MPIPRALEPDCGVCYAFQCWGTLLANLATLLTYESLDLLPSRRISQTVLKVLTTTLNPPRPWAVGVWVAQAGTPPQIHFSLPSHPPPPTPPRPPNLTDRHFFHVSIRVRGLPTLPPPQPAPSPPCYRSSGRGGLRSVKITGCD